MDGIVNINKPIGWSSFKAVERIKRLSRPSKVGHAGTLDPMATGILIILIGEACKISELFLKQDKTYTATIALGYESDTWDNTGKITKVSEPDISKEKVLSALEEFVGEYSHMVPELSAKKYCGQPFYKIKRTGSKPPKRIQKTFIKKIALIKHNKAEISVSVDCTSGTYIRTLAVDIAKQLRTSGYLKDLTRTKVGNFKIKDSVIPDNWKDGFMDLDQIMMNFPYVVINNEASDKLSKGIGFEAGSIIDSSLKQTTGDIIGVFSEDMRIKALATQINGSFKLKRVFKFENHI